MPLARRAGAGDPHRRRGLSGLRDHRGGVGRAARALLRADAGGGARLPAGRPGAARRARSSGTPIWPRPIAQLAADGRDAFYRGDIAQAHRRAARRSTAARLTAADLAEYDAEWVTPLSTTYRGWTVYELPPNGQGIAALMMLNLLEHFPIGELRPQLRRGAAHADRGEEARVRRHGTARRAIRRFTTCRWTRCCRRRTPRSRARVRSIRRAPTPRSRPGTLPTQGGDTTYLSVVDRDGNMVSLIQSNFANFGSGLVPDGTRLRAAEPRRPVHARSAHPNALAPRKRPLHTIIPGLHEPAATGADRVRHHGRLEPVAGARAVRLERRRSRDEHPGGARSRALHQAHLRRPRRDRWSRACRRRSATQLARHGTRDRRAGQLLEPGRRRPERDARLRSTGVNYGASDPRKDGAAIPEPSL